METNNDSSNGTGNDATRKADQPQGRPIVFARNHFAIPVALKQLFDRFPLVVYKPNELPARAIHKACAQDKVTLFIFTEDQDAVTGAPSYNPACLKWQTYLKFCGLDFAVKSSNNHASPSGALPFIMQPGSENAISAARIPDFIETQKGLIQPRDPIELRYYESLVDGPIRSAYLYAVYVDGATFDEVVVPLYINRTSSNALVRRAQMQPLRRAAMTQVLEISGTCQDGIGPSYQAEDGGLLLERADEAFKALDVLLGSKNWFSETKPGDGSEKSQGAGSLDALVFSYTHVILSILGHRKDGPASQLLNTVLACANLLRLHNRIFELYYPRRSITERL